MDNNFKEVIYEHLVFSGSSYEIGKLEGDFLKKQHPEEIQVLLKGNDYIKPASQEKIKRAMKVFQKYCPQINEEIQGMAESLGVSADSIIHYAFSYVSKGNCGHFAVLPEKTLDKHFYLGRSYEWGTDDELRLMTIKAKGLNAHMGFSLILLGRMDGINEQGLCITMSNAVPLCESEEEGLRFWMVIRILLDKCKDCEEAVTLIKELPISACCNFIIADRNNNAVLAEIHNSAKVFKYINGNTEQQYLCSTNHYTFEEMKEFVKNKMRQSVYRYDAMVKKLEAENKIEKSALKELLSTNIPNGLACHYYDEWLGTLWSMLFDVSESKVQICFGSPAVNQWYDFNLNSPDGITKYKAVFPMEKAEDSMWERIR
ncbi:hypothetical protein IAI10_12720 [Clostridium sp. 19966]|uniref:C45 family peptidase n=1 Tax=Clostridium sp. 19966 TaxID=2768166 RepID=UPI0028DDDC5C|nr:C45 family peptidase [Clostridium sp. 19966]MDT8717527.1 hypothetical protein [Clostridium sp. 19966]